MKVLLSAYACEPGRGTELGVGWNTAWEIAKYHEVWVLTRPDDGREAIESELSRNPNPNLHFVYFTLPVLGSIWRFGSIAFLIHYYFWQVQAYFVARRLHQEINFDVAHHVTFVRHSTPSFLALLPIPFIWGPVGGGESAPNPFWRDFSFRNRVYEILRSAARWFGERDPFARMTARRSTIVRVTTQDTAIRVQEMGAKKIEVFPEASLTKEEIVRLTQYASTDITVARFISMGRLLHWKGFHLGLRAFALAGLPEAEYWVFGDGPERQRLESLAAELGIANQVKFWNRLPRDEVLQKLGSCTALVHPSLHDSGGWVCLEAMTAARPVICLNLGGPAIQVTDKTGFKVNASDPDLAVQGLAAAMVRLANDPELRLAMGQAGQLRVKEFYNWEIRGQQIVKLYGDVVRATSLSVGVSS
ncbi:glycosyltransferase family 4 protein [Pseudanabaena sp. PCC 6802]|uniref:glycosyltransferase family 4 protein n=1 Tax=Pseudanabaena sp. PCC 6802 TaxID=118173 RepID=UPI00034D7C39|nr:glycosyltransferase [Pseudanabaena sp. PCC 6802]